MKVKNRERIHSLFSIALSLSLVLTPLPVHATDTGGTDAGADTGSSPTTIDVSANGSEETSVYAEIGSHYELTIPKRITLDGDQKTGSYSVAVTGDIPGTEVVSVVPDTSFTMSSHKIDDATALATQDKTLWRYSDMLPTDPVVAAGEIDATAISAGEWDGKLNFNTELKEHDCSNFNMANSRTVSVPWVNTSNGSYKFAQSGTTWTSDNKGVNGSTATSTWTVDLEEETDYSIKYKVSSESNSDKLTVKLDDTTIADEISGAGTEQAYTTTLTAGSHTLVATYSKNGSSSSNDDQAYVVLETSVTTGGHTCDICNASSTHIYDEGTITTEPTCTTEGVKIFKCISCNDSYTEIIAAGHADEDGDVICDVCGESTAGLYDENDVMVASWDELLEDGTIQVTNGVLSKGSGAETALAGKLVIDNSVTSIGDSTFSGCSGLTSIDIPSSVTSIGRHAFEGCSSLTSITIPSSVTSIRYDAFKNCTSLTSIDIPSSVTNIGEGTFYSCTSLTSINIPDSIISIGGQAFYGCSKLTSITIPSSVKSIEYQAFSGCSELTSINIPGSVTRIDRCAFQSCKSLTSITIPSNITSIRSYTFNGCTSLTSIDIPSSVTSVGEGAFQYCSSLTSVNIPDSVTSIERYAFKECIRLTNIDIPSSVTSIGDSTFSGCSGLTNITIPSSVTSIGSYAFNGCSSLTSITIPSSVTSIGERTFSFCYSFTINYKGTEEQWNAVTKGSDWSYCATPTIIYNYTE